MSDRWTPRKRPRRAPCIRLLPCEQTQTTMRRAPIVPDFRHATVTWVETEEEAGARDGGPDRVEDTADDGAAYVATPYGTTVPRWAWDNYMAVRG